MPARSGATFVGAAIVAALVTVAVLRSIGSLDDPAASTTAETSSSPGPSRSVVPLLPAATGPRVTIRAAPTPSLRAYTFPISGCRSDYSADHHDYPATDIFTGPGCAFVSPVDGRVDEIGRVDQWDPKISEGSTRGGLFVSVVGVDGVRYYGSHLAAVETELQVGQRVAAGQPLGRVGDTGSARGTGIHLHFGISWPTRNGYWWIRRGVLGPAPYLDSWRSTSALSPVDALRSMRSTYGDDSTCRTYC